jgi:outer membrane protein assembly factor BamB
VATALAASLLSLSLAGCSKIPWFGGDKDPTPPTKLTDLVPQVNLTELWSDRVTKGTLGRRLFLVPAVSRLSV